RNTTSAPGEPPTSAKNSASISARSPISVSRLFQTRAVPARRRSQRSSFSPRGLNVVACRANARCRRSSRLGAKRLWDNPMVRVWPVSIRCRCDDEALREKLSGRESLDADRELLLVHVRGRFLLTRRLYFRERPHI